MSYSCAFVQTPAGTFLGVLPNTEDARAASATTARTNFIVKGNVSLVFVVVRVGEEDVNGAETNEGTGCRALISKLVRILHFRGMQFVVTRAL